MCLTCGCNKPTEQHGDAANITLADLQAAAEAQGISIHKAAKNLVNALLTAGEVRMATNSGGDTSRSRFVSQGDEEFLSDFEIIDEEEAADAATAKAEERSEETVSGKPPARSAAMSALRNVISRRRSQHGGFFTDAQGKVHPTSGGGGGGAGGAGAGSGSAGGASGGNRRAHPYPNQPAAAAAGATVMDIGGVYGKIGQKFAVGQSDLELGAEWQRDVTDSNRDRSVPHASTPHAHDGLGPHLHDGRNPYPMTHSHGSDPREDAFAVREAVPAERG